MRYILAILSNFKRKGNENSGGAVNVLVIFPFILLKTPNTAFATQKGLRTKYQSIVG